MRKIVLITFLLIAHLLPPAWAEEPEAFSVKGPANTDRLSFQEIADGKLLVSVADKDEKPIMGLMPEDFSIVKGNRAAKVTGVEPLATSKDVGLNIVLVVDNSISMRDRKAVQPLLEAMEAFYQIIRPIDNINIIVYDDKKTIEAEGHAYHARILESKDIGALRSMVNEQMSKGLSSGTYLYDAIMVGLDVARKWPEKSNKFMVVLTDGEDINSGIKAEAVIEAARNIPNFGAFSVDYMPAATLDGFLRTFAKENNGHIWKASSASELVPIFKKFSSTLLHRYIVSYRFLDAPTGGIALEPGEVTIEELSTIDSAPLLNYIFFETGRSDIPNRYVQLTSQSETEAFSEIALTSVMEKYQHLLNIIGRRLREYPDTAVTIVGCTSNTGQEYNRQDLARSRAESVRAYLRYIWGIAPDRMAVQDRNLPEAPSTNRLPEGQAENQRVEIRSENPEILDTVKSEYVENISDVQQIKIIPNITAEAGIQDWDITMRCGDDIIGTFSGSGDMAPEYVFSVEKGHLDKMVTAGNIDIDLHVRDKETKELSLKDAASLPVRFIRRQEQMAQKQGYKVREKYALILFDYDSSAIKSRNKIIVDRIVGRLKDVPQADMDIVGHTDNIGKEDYNIKLSERRAEAVKTQFVQEQQSTPNNLSVSGDGPNTPLYDNDTPEGRALNRTVTIALEYQEI